MDVVRLGYSLSPAVGAILASARTGGAVEMSNPFRELPRVSMVERNQVPKSKNTPKGERPRELLTSRATSPQKIRRCFKQHACTSTCFRICASFGTICQSSFGRLRIKCYHHGFDFASRRQGRKFIGEGEEGRISTRVFSLPSRLLTAEGRTVCSLDKVPLKQHPCAGQGR